MSDSSGKAQGLAIDNLTFSASDQPAVETGPGLNVQTANGSLVMSWLSVSGTSYQIEYNDNLNSNIWTALGSPLLGTGSILTVTNDISQSSQRFYRLRIVP